MEKGEKTWGGEFCLRVLGSDVLTGQAGTSLGVHRKGWGGAISLLSSSAEWMAHEMNRPRP